jgi:hypothetical protein
MKNLWNGKEMRVKPRQRTFIYLVALLFAGSSRVSYSQSGATAVRDLPFSANEWITKTSTASDGTVKVTTQQIVIARASDGTIRREIHEVSPGSDRVVDGPIIVVSILNQDTNTNSATLQGKAAVTAMDTSRLKTPPTSSAKTAPSKPVNSPASGETTILNGFRAVVHRSQYTAPASAPNGKAVIVTTALWYSPDLRVALKSSISDSGGTTVDTVLDDIHRQEPDSALFRISTEAKAIQK